MEKSQHYVEKTIAEEGGHFWTQPKTRPPDNHNGSLYTRMDNQRQEATVRLF